MATKIDIFSNLVCILRINVKDNSVMFSTLSLKRMCTLRQIEIKFQEVYFPKFCFNSPQLFFFFLFSLSLKMILLSCTQSTFHCFAINNGNMLSNVIRQGAYLHKIQ